MWTPSAIKVLISALGRCYQNGIFHQWQPTKHDMKQTGIPWDKLPWKPSQPDKVLLMTVCLRIPVYLTGHQLHSSKCILQMADTTENILTGCKAKFTRHRERWWWGGLIPFYIEYLQLSLTKTLVWWQCLTRHPVSLAQKATWQWLCLFPALCFFLLMTSSRLPWWIRW